MKLLHLTLLAFCQLLIASFVLYSSYLRPTDALPVDQPQLIKVESGVAKPDAIGASPVEPKYESVPSLVQTKLDQGEIQARLAPESSKVPEPEQQGKSSASAEHNESRAVQPVEPPKISSSPLEARKAEPELQPSTRELASPKSAQVEPEPEKPVLVAPAPVVEASPAVPTPEHHQIALMESEKPTGQGELKPYTAALVAEQKPEARKEDEIVGRAELEISPIVKPLASQPLVASVSVVEPVREPVKETIAKVVYTVQAPVVDPVAADVKPVKLAETRAVPSEPVVYGGLGPLYLLASTLCNQTLEQPPADEQLNALYNRRAALRRSLFEYLSLKFTHLEKLSSKLNGGLELVPIKAVDPKSSKPSHGWPVVGRCTAHDLKLMAEAAWCDSAVAANSPVVRPFTAVSMEQAPLGRLRRSTELEDAAAVSKILYMSDMNNLPAVESTIASLNLNPQELVTFKNSLEDYKCRRNALKMTKSMFEHLAEDQRNKSEIWPNLFASISHNECARKRMIDVVNALAGFRGEASSIRRDNLEYAFATDDLRAKVLESDLSKPLTFDKQFIEVEQFLQQSVRLMLANIDPERAKLTSMRYRSLISTDDQCIELHQRLLAKSYPTDCNPIEFGQLPDVLRMTANSLELWSIEKEIGNYASKSAEPVVSSSATRDDINQCIANLVAK